jgi:hypothetical protein
MDKPITAAQFRLLDRYTEQELARLKRKREKLRQAMGVFRSTGIDYDVERINKALEFIEIEENIAKELKQKLEQ